MYFTGVERGQKEKKSLIQKPSENIHAIVDIDTQTLFLFERGERKEENIEGKIGVHRKKKRTVEYIQI